MSKSWLHHAIDLSIEASIKYAESNEDKNLNKMSPFVKMFMLMLKNGFTTHQKDEEEVQPLLYVAKELYSCRNIEKAKAKICNSIINVLLHRKNENIGINSRDKDNKTALHYLFFTDYSNTIIGILARNDLDLNNLGIDNATIFHFLCNCCKKRTNGKYFVAVLEKLLNFNSFEVNTVDSNKKTLLHLACQYCSLEIIEVIYKHQGKNIDFMKCDNSMKTFLFYGRHPRHSQGVFEYLLNETPKYVNNEKMKEILKSQDNEGKTILHYYCAQDNIYVKKSTISKILELGGMSLIDIKDKHGADPYYWARYAGNAEIYDLVRTTGKRLLINSILLFISHIPQNRIIIMIKV